MQKHNINDTQEIINYYYTGNTKNEKDKLLKLKTNVSGLVSSSLKFTGRKKNSKIELILGCKISEFKLHIESQFESWMNWNNKGMYNGKFNYGWDIDHIIPLSAAKNEEDVYKLNHYTNLQPLCSYTNRYVKRNSNNILSKFKYRTKIEYKLNEEDFQPLVTFNIIESIYA